MNPPASTHLRFSIVVIELVGGEALATCLSALQKFDIEIFVVLKEACPQLQARFDHVRFEIRNQPVPLRRKSGVALASGDVVALIEDTTLPGDSLLNGLVSAFKDDNTLAASGPVLIGNSLPSRYQALACTEYGRYHPSVLFDHPHQQSRTVERLPGNFICYRREVLASVLSEYSEGLVEGVINQRLLSEGGSLVMEPMLANTYGAEDQCSGRLATRFHHGWIYAGGQAKQKNVFACAVQFLKSLLLPTVLSFRAIRCMRGMNEIRHPLKVSLWICLLETFWSAGEAVGSVSGAPKNMEHWR
ncbi:hypothetical protein [Marinobacter sp.]|jgi:hypothetical protein|uniref:hypothetical protein n=1 Tax=Marinobacter sp. TaxID=50741 RepID=UPI002356B658|nr:hypothetical protein [Marinobacter sp.]|tara:strand:- start:1304 stop:2209 length:906 start_codon:yes stop_codon:yes gene_type:complete